MNLDLELARLEQREQLVGIELVFFTGLNVSEQLRTGDLEVLGREFPTSFALASSRPLLEQMTY